MRGSTRKRGKKWYYYFTTSEGKKIERVGGDTQAEAEAALVEALADYHKRGEVIMDSNMLLSEYFPRWLKEYAKSEELRESTVALYQNRYNTHILPALGGKRLSRLTPDVLQQYVNTQKAHGNLNTGGELSREMLVGITTLLSNALKSAVYPYRLLRENPMQYIRMPRYRSGEQPAENQKLVAQEDFDTLVEYYRGRKRYVEIPILIQFYTGMRPGEVCALTWDCVDLDGCAITIKHTLHCKKDQRRLGPPKTDSSYRTVKISPSLVNVLKDHRRRQVEDKLFYGADYTSYDHAYICTNPAGVVYNPRALTNSLARTCKKLGLPHVHAHMLRHTHATMLWEAGADQNDIKNRLGHKTLAMTADRYAHDTPEMQRRTVEIFDNTLATRKTGSSGK